MQIHEGLSEAQIVEFTKTEKKCKRKKDFYEWNHFAESLIDAGAKKWAIEVSKEQLKGSKQFSDRKRWFELLIKLEQFDFIEKQIKTITKKAKTSHDYKHLAEAVCANELLKNKYARNFYEEAVNLAIELPGDYYGPGKNIVYLSSLAESVLNESFLNDKGYAKEIINKALSVLFNSSILSSEGGSSKMGYITDFIEIADKLGDQEFKNKIIDKACQVDDPTVHEILKLINSLNDTKQIQKLLEKAKGSVRGDWGTLSDYFYEKGEVQEALNILKIGIKEINKEHEEASLFEKLNKLQENGAQDVQTVLQLLLENIDAHTPKIDFSENMFIDYNPEWGRYLSIYLDFKDMAKKGNVSIYLDMEKRTILGRRIYNPIQNSPIIWQGVYDTPTRVSNAIDFSLKTYTGKITVKSADTLESFKKNEFNHEWVQDQKLRNVKKPKLRFEKVEWLWELSCKNGELLDATKSISESCRADDILKTVGDGKQIWNLRTHMFSKFRNDEFYF